MKHSEPNGIQQIAARNDQHRQRLSPLELAPELASLPARDVSALLLAVSDYDNFTPENDPSGEHSEGTVTVSEMKFTWRITAGKLSQCLKISPEQTSGS